MSTPRTEKPSTRVEHFSFAGITEKLSPIGLHVYAEDFLAAAKATKEPEFLGQFKPARPYLTCHAIECALKAFLTLKGYDLKKLADREFGHDLANILDHAEAQGLRDTVPLTDEQLFHIRRASAYYAGKVFEYPALAEAPEGYPGNADVPTLFAAADALIGALRQPCLGAK